MKWFTLWWWQYLFAVQNPWAKAYLRKRPTWKMILCRMRGHDDVIWFNSSGLEPDMHCKRCGEDLG